MLFEVEVEERVYDALAKTIKDFEPFKALWVTADLWIRRKEEWMNGSFTAIDADDLESVVMESFKTMSKQARFFQQKDVAGCAAVASHLRDEIEAFKPYVPVVKALRNPGMRERHWEGLADKIAETQGTEHRAIELETLALYQVVDSWHMHEPGVLPSVLAVAEVSSKEYAIERSLDKMLGLWQPMEYNVFEYRETKTFVIKGTDDINTLLDDHIVATQAMSFSPVRYLLPLARFNGDALTPLVLKQYKKVFEERIAGWENTLKLVQDITTEWLAAQRNWMYLQVRLLMLFSKSLIPWAEWSGRFQ